MQVDLRLDALQLQKQFPSFPGADECTEVTIQAGQMLYLPAGWFHEVTSYSVGAQDTHVAVNYWFHPPDNLTSTPNASCGRRFPYSSDYWPALWNERITHHGWNDDLRVAERGEPDSRNASRGDAADSARKRRKKF